MRKFTKVAPVVIAVVLTPFALADGPVHDWYLTDGTRLFKAQGTSSTNTNTQTGNEFPLAVRGDIRTVHSNPGQGGALYDRDLRYLGTDYINNASGPIWDATTDGLYIYSIIFATAQVVRFDMDWTNPRIMFDLGGNGDYLAITYDPANHSLWVGQWDIGTMVQNFDMEGVLLSEFDVGTTLITCLGLDHSEGTLWLGTQSDPGVYREYFRDGTFLGSVDYAWAHNTLGGEFDLGAVATIERMRARVGRITNGGTRDLENPDRSIVVVKAKRQSNGSDKAVVEFRTRADSPSDSRIHIAVLTKTTSSTLGNEWIFLWNWTRGGWDRVGTQVISSRFRRATVYNQRGTDYIRSNGLIRVRITHKVTNPSDPKPFKSKFEVVQVRTLK